MQRIGIRNRNSSGLDCKACVQELEANLRQSTQLLSRTESLLVQAQSDRDQLRAHLSQFLGPHPTAGPSIPPSALVDSGTTSSSSDPAAAVFAQAATGAVNGASEAGLTGATTAAASSAATVAPGVHGPDTQSYKYSGTGSVGEEEWSGVHLTRNASQAAMSGLGELWQPNAGARKSSGAGDHAGKLDASVVRSLFCYVATVGLHLTSCAAVCCDMHACCGTPVFKDFFLTGT